MPKKSPPRTLSRRRLLGRFGLSAAALGTGACATAPSGTRYPERNHPPENRWSGKVATDNSLFPLRTQSGDPHPTTLLCWTRYAGNTTLQLCAARWTNGAWVELPAESVTQNAGGFVHHILTGLSPDEPIAFQFVDANGMGSSIGYARTAIANDSTAIVRFGATSCTSQAHIDFPSLEHLARDFEMDFSFGWRHRLR